MKNPKQQFRGYLVLIVLFAGLLGLSCRLVYLQVVQHDALTEIADAERDRRIIYPARRGDIRDRNGALLATSLPVRTVYLDAHVWAENPPTPEITTQFIQLLHLDSTDLQEKVATDKRYLVLARKVSPLTAETIKTLKIRAIGFEEDFQRQYPLGRCLSHVLGFEDFDHRGVQGIERTMETCLAGQPGWRLSPKDNRGREIVAWRQEEIPARDGDQVELTIDRVIQNIVETELAKGVAAHHPLDACAIVMQPFTGEILAMASWPNFDPNQPGADAIESQKNIPVVNVMEPGSTFKIVAVAGALNDSTVQSTDVIFCENGTFPYGGRVLRDSHPHGNLPVWQVIQVSSNIGAAKIALRMGPDRLYHYIESFGFGVRTGVDLPAEVGGILHPLNRWTKLSITRIPMGQEIGVTPLQMVTAMSALANGGNLMKPYVIRRVLRKDGTVLASYSPQWINRPVSARTAGIMNEALQTVVNAEGTGKKAALEGWTVAGKTGTAQKYENGLPSHTKFIASFIGYLPADHPQICVLVMFDEPKGVYYGGDVAAPLFHNIAEKTALYLNIPPHSSSGNPSGPTRQLPSHKVAYSTPTQSARYGTTRIN